MPATKHAPEFKRANGVVPRHLLLPLSVGKSQGLLPTDVIP